MSNWISPLVYALVALLVPPVCASAAQHDEAGETGARSLAWRLEDLPPNDLEPYHGSDQRRRAVRRSGGPSIRLLTVFDQMEPWDFELRYWKTWHAGRMHRTTHDREINASVDLIR